MQAAVLIHTHPLSLGPLLNAPHNANPPPQANQTNALDSIPYQTSAPWPQGPSTSSTAATHPLTTHSLGLQGVQPGTSSQSMYRRESTGAAPQMHLHSHDVGMRLEPQGPHAIPPPYPSEVQPSQSALRYHAGGGCMHA